MEAENQKKPRCTVEEDLEMLRRYQNGDQKALEDLVLNHLGLIYFWVGKVSRRIRWANLDDLKQDGCVGFIETARKFDASENENFHGHARVSVKAALYRGREVSRVKPSQFKNYRKVMKAQDELMRKLERMPTLEELAKETQLSVRQVDNALNVIAAFPFPLEEAEGRFVVEDSDQSQLIAEAINQLTPYEAKIIVRYYFFSRTGRQIAEELGTTEEAIKTTRHRALKKLRKIIVER